MKDKINTIQKSLASCEALLITNFPGRFYLTGFSSSAGSVFITKNFAALFIDFRYYEKAKKTVSHLDVVLASNVISQINDVVLREKIECIYIETNYTNLHEYAVFSKGLNAKLSSSDKFDVILNDMRACKTASELENIKKAQTLVELTFDHILERIGPGMTERDIMLDMEFFMRKQGSEGVAFDFIVVSGKNSSLPHGTPTDKKIEKGDFVTMDFGAKINGYCSDMTRTVAVGHVTDEQRTVYNTVLNAQKKAMKLIKPGTVCRDVDNAAREYIYESGYKGCFGHGLGHSIGIEVHEDPNFNTRCDTVLKPGMVLSVEPGIYLEGKFGVRIEDLICVTDDGYEDLTSSPKELIIV